MKQVYENRNQLVSDLNNLVGNGKGVELGVFKGEFSNVILKNWSGTLYMVDVWRPLGEEYNDESNHKNYGDVFTLTMKNIEGYEDRGIMIRATTEIASELFAEESLDFIYIDANHSYEFIKQDLNTWFPKLKKGGVFSGHDYINIDWYNDPYWCQNMKDKPVFFSIINDSGESEIKFAGEFGVNSAVDEFCSINNYELNVTKEWWGTWWFIK